MMSLFHQVLFPINSVAIFFISNLAKNQNYKNLIGLIATVIARNLNLNMKFFFDKIIMETYYAEITLKKQRIA
jgi:hypothetical protein